MRGDLNIDEVERILGYQLPAGDFETLAGAAITRFGGFPSLGDVVTIALKPDAADLVDEARPVIGELVAEVRQIDSHGPSLRPSRSASARWGHQMNSP